MTLLSTMGEKDRDLSPAHDKLMFWLEGYITKGEFCSKHARWMFSAFNHYFCNHRPSPDTAICLDDQRDDEWHLWAQGNRDKIPSRPAPEITKLTWERPLFSGGTKAIAFIDMCVEMKGHSLKLCSRYGGDKKYEFSWEVEPGTWRFLFEVKPTVPSIGQLLRQLKQYRALARESGGRYFVVSPPDERLTEILRREGFYKIDCPNGPEADTTRP
jgi:hypothetical protein